MHDLRPEGAPAEEDDASSTSSDSLMAEAAEYPPRYHRQEEYDAMAAQMHFAARLAEHEVDDDDYEAVDTSIEDVDDVGHLHHHHHHHQHEEEPEEEVEEEHDEHDPAAAMFDPTTMGLKEISNLGKFTVSTHKQGNGVEELRSDDLKQYWQ